MSAHPVAILLMRIESQHNGVTSATLPRPKRIATAIHKSRNILKCSICETNPARRSECSYGERQDWGSSVSKIARRQTERNQVVRLCEGAHLSDTVS